METFICVTEADFPAWFMESRYSHAREVADRYIDEHEIILARRADGQVQVIHDGYLDSEVIAELMRWAAGG
jgi:hypothetical protein